MPFTIAALPTFDKHQEPEEKLCHLMGLESLEAIYPRQQVSALVTQEQGWEAREKKLKHLVMIYLVMLLCLYPRHSIAEIMALLARVARFQHESSEAPASAGALS
jgi:hypothetical protein